MQFQLYCHSPYSRRIEWAADASYDVSNNLRGYRYLYTCMFDRVEFRDRLKCTRSDRRRGSGSNSGTDLLVSVIPSLTDILSNFTSRPSNPHDVSVQRELGWFINPHALRGALDMRRFIYAYARPDAYQEQELASSAFQPRGVRSLLSRSERANTRGR